MINFSYRIILVLGVAAAIWAFKARYYAVACLLTKNNINNACAGDKLVNYPGWMHTAISATTTAIDPAQCNNNFTTYTGLCSVSVSYND